MNDLRATLHKKVSLFLGTFVALLLLAGLAVADEPVTVAVFELEGEGIDDELLETLTSVLRQEAQQHSGYALVNPSALKRNEVALIVGCDPSDIECLRELAEYVEGRVLIFGEVRRQGEQLTIAVDILDAEIGRAPRRVERIVSTSPDPVSAFQREVAAVFRGLDSLGETRLLVRAPDAEIAIRLEDVMVGRGELVRQGLPPGTYRIALGERSAPLWEGEVELRPGETVEVQPEVQWPAEELKMESATPSTTTPVVPGQRGREEGLVVIDDAPSYAGPYTLIGLGAVTLATGGLMTYLMRNTEATIRRENAAGNMTEERYDSLVAEGARFEQLQYVFYGVGALGLASGTGWWIVNRRSERGANAKAPARLEVLAGPTQITVRGSF